MDALVLANSVTLGAILVLKLHTMKQMQGLRDDVREIISRQKVDIDKMLRDTIRHVEARMIALQQGDISELYTEDWREQNGGAGLP